MRSTVVHLLLDKLNSILMKNLRSTYLDSSENPPIYTRVFSLFSLCIYILYSLICYGCDISDELIITDAQMNTNTFGSTLDPTLNENSSSSDLQNQNETGGLNSSSSEIPCTPGESTGLCTLCGADSMPTLAQNDPDCPVLDCSLLTRYQQTILDDGGVLCEQVPFMPNSTSCKEIGVCHEDVEEYCTMQDPEPLFTAYEGCRSFVGCQDDIPPSATSQPEGATCNGFGTCQADGQCNAPIQCARLDAVGINQACAAVNEDQCEVYASASSYSNLSEINCLAYCQRGARLTCKQAWEANGPCNKGSNINCSTNKNDLICLCGP